MKLRRYWKVWWTSTKLSASSNLANRRGSIAFVLGKFMRFGFFIYFLFILGGNVKEVAGYDFSTLLVFFLVFNLFDMFGQIFFRGIYWFREQVVTGEFDFRLVKPMSALFQALTRQTDFLDLPLLLVIIVALFNLGIDVSLQDGLQFGLLTVAGMILVTTIHIVIASLGVLTTEVDHTIMIYRDLSMMARFPIDIYSSMIRALLTFVIPIGLIFTMPAKALLGLLTINNSLIIFFGSIGFLTLSLRLWKYALTKYSSASS